MAVDADPPLSQSAQRRIGRPKDSDGERTRQLLLDVAFQRLATVGYDRMNLEDVAREVGITRGGIYRYFPTKPELARAAVLKWSKGVQSTEDSFCELAKDARGLREQLRAFVLACVRQTLGDPQPATRFFELGALGEHDEVLADLYKQQSSYVRARVRGLVADGARRGELAQGADQEEVIETVLGLIWVMSKAASAAPNDRVRAQITRVYDVLLQDPPWLA
jgi:AcrR family transcriptional regulator